MADDDGGLSRRSVESCLRDDFLYDAPECPDHKSVARRTIDPLRAVQRDVANDSRPIFDLGSILGVDGFDDSEKVTHV